MRKIFRGILIVVVFICTLLCSSIVFADGAPAYNRNMYAVVVNNRNGAELLYQDWSNEAQEFVITKTDMVPYGTKFVVVDTTQLSGETYLYVSEDSEIFGGGNLIASSDVEIYGKLITPLDLRIKRTKSKRKNCLFK